MMAPVVRALAIACVAGMALVGAHAAAAASLYDPNANCISGAPAGWVTAPAKPSDQFTVRAPAAYASRAGDAASEIRSKNIFGDYETKLGITRLGYTSQTGRLDVFLDPQLPQAYKNANGINASRCENAAIDAVDVNAGIANAEEFHAAIAHELFHAAQAQLGGDYTNNWWYEATATWAETMLGYDKPVPDGFSALVTNLPLQPMDTFSQAPDGTNAHEYGAWTFVAWLMSRHKLSWTQLGQSFAQAKASDPTPIVDQLLAASGTSIADEVASYWADHLNDKPSFGPTAHMTVVKVSQKTDEFGFQPAKYLGSAPFAIRPSASKQQIVVIVKKPAPGVQVWVKTGDGNKDLVRVAPGESFNETFCRSGATPGSYDLPKSGEVRIAITTTSQTPPPDVKFKVITSTEPCPKKILVIPGIAIGSLHLGMTAAEAKAAAPRHHLFGTVPTPLGAWQPGAFNVDDALVIAEFLDGRIAALFTESFRARTTTGIRISALQLPHYIPGTDDYDRPILIPGSTMSQFGASDCTTLPGKNPPNMYCWYQDPPTRYTLALAGQVDPCPVDGGPNDHDDDPDMRICDYPEDWYIGGLAVATSKGAKLLHGLASLLKTGA
jgi:hypothetical protein